MDSQRLILFFVFSFSVFMLLDAWQRDQQQAAAPSEKPPAASQPAAKAPPVDVPTPSQKLAPPQPSSVPQPAPAATPAHPTVTVETDAVVAEISTYGGDLRHLRFKKHRDQSDANKGFVLLETGPDRTYVAQSGLIGEGLPNHRSLFTAESLKYALQEGQEELEVRLRATDASGVDVVKIYRFRRGSYLIDVSFEITNRRATAIQPYAYFQIVRDGTPPAGDSAMMPTYTGPAIYTDSSKFRKVSFDEIAEGKASFPKQANDGWIAMIQHYFFSAWIPKQGMPREYFMRRLDGNLYAAGVIVADGSLATGQTASVSVPFYAGPQEQENLAKIAPGLDLTIDYGWLTIIAVPLFWLLSLFHDWVGNWGVAIILLTVVIKALFYPLSAASYRSMAKMRVLAPKLQRIKDQYGDDRQRMQQAMMDLYRTEKINPLGGCMPILVQIPVFIALYWVLLASVELRHAPFVLWIKDLAAPDPWFILPVLMAVTMWFQTKLNPEPPDPVQARVMKIMPIVFSVFFFFFPAGLVLYWLVNNILSIAQQWHITRVLEREAPGRKT